LIEILTHVYTIILDAITLISGIEQMQCKGNIGRCIHGMTTNYLIKILIKLLLFSYSTLTVCVY